MITPRDRKKRKRTTVSTKTTKRVPRKKWKNSCVEVKFKTATNTEMKMLVIARRMKFLRCIRGKR